jgi:hypothetical protein
MPDLTPQLRTRLTRLERLVGLFVSIATLLLLGGLFFYAYRVAERRGWFDRKMPYFTFVRTASGLKVGDPVKLMGFEAGKITRITAQPPEDPNYNVFVAFVVKEPFYGYLWEDSRAKVAAGDFLGNRYLEVTKGTNGAPTYLFHPIEEVGLAEAKELTHSNAFKFAEEVYDTFGTNRLARAFEQLSAQALQRIAEAGWSTVRLIDQATEKRAPVGIWDDKDARYLLMEKIPRERKEKGYFLLPSESPALTERLDNVVNAVEAALPGVLDLTNQIRRVLTQAAGAAGSAEQLLGSAGAIVTNLTQITQNLTNTQGALGDWLFTTNLSAQLTQTLFSANALLTNSDARVTDLATGLDSTLQNLANLTSNLHAQVGANTNLVGELSRLIINTDDLVQGLKRHWLLRSAFKTKPVKSTNAPPPRLRSPRDTAP